LRIAESAVVSTIFTTTITTARQTSLQLHNVPKQLDGLDLLQHSLAAYCRSFKAQTDLRLRIEVLHGWLPSAESDTALTRRP
jgi:hypothetical protein